MTSWSIHTLFTALKGYGLTKTKRVWINQDVIDGQRCMFLVVYLLFLKLTYIFEQICQLPVMCGATTTNDAIKAFRYAQQRHLMHYVVKWVLTLSKFYPNFIQIKINFLICKVNGQWHQMHLFQAYLLTRYIHTYSCQFLQPKLGSAIILTKVLQGVSAIHTG